MAATVKDPTMIYPGASLNALRELFYSISGWHDQDSLLPLAGIREYFTRPWWGRVWVLQEITLPRDAELVCGTKSITRSRCRAAINAYVALWITLTARFRSEPSSLGRYHLEIVKHLFHHRPILMLSSYTIYKHERVPLAALLRATCVGTTDLSRHGPHHLQATDPRDKIFALLGLAADREELKGLGLVPDYTKSYEQIYATAMVAMLRQGHFSLLSMCQAPPSTRRLPSWVPDWSNSVTDMLQDVRNDHITLYPSFNASGPIPQGLDVSVSWEEGSITGISISCVLYDRIQETAHFPNRSTSHKVPLLETTSWPFEWLLEYLRLTYCNKTAYNSFEMRLRAAARCSIGGVCWDDDTKLVRVKNTRFYDAVALLRQGVGNIKHARIGWEARRFLSTTGVPDIPNYGATIFTRLVSEINGKSLKRLPFITNSGHLGLGHEYIQRGDFVALVSGVQVPVVLRCLSAGWYQVVGEAYVDGIMDGEAVENAQYSTVKLV